MAQDDRQRLLARALALPQAGADDFHGGRTPPPHADAKLLKRIDDTALRTKLVAVGLAEGLQSPKGPQKIPSILRVYPAFNAPPRSRLNGRPKARRGRPPGAARQPVRERPRVDELERLLRRYREVEQEVTGELSVALDEQIAQLKRSLAELDGDALEAAYHELGEAFERKRAVAARIGEETFRRLETDSGLPERVYLLLLAR
ncbi:MAG: hypothetical protein M3R44_04705 [Candidatus Eremiobacteraeota bacterium]|nr:hypothetical protein [Candidatus Eremiobacteraeota bacterium]